MESDVANGTRRVIGDRECIYYDGYWIRYYPPPPDSLAAKKRLIDSLTRRLFHHTEPGINTPGERLEAAERFVRALAGPVAGLAIGKHDVSR